MSFLAANNSGFIIKRVFSTTNVILSEANLLSDDELWFVWFLGGGGESVKAIGDDEGLYGETVDEEANDIGCDVNDL